MKMAYSAGRTVLRGQIEGVIDTLARGPEELEAAFGLEEEEEEESDIDL